MQMKSASASAGLVRNARCKCSARGWLWARRSDFRLSLVVIVTCPIRVSKTSIRPLIGLNWS